jgi:hypothetical protein
MLGNSAGIRGDLASISRNAKPDLLSSFFGVALAFMLALSIES